MTLTGRTRTAGLPRSRYVCGYLHYCSGVADAGHCTCRLPTLGPCVLIIASWRVLFSFNFLFDLLEVCVLQNVNSTNL
jgi:hypothetical protein